MPTPFSARPACGQPASKQKPLVLATAAACFALAAGSAQAVGCATSVTTETTTAATVCSNLTVSSAGAIDVSGSTAVTISTGNEFSTSIDNSGRITGSTAIYLQDDSSSHETQIYNRSSGVIVGQSHAVNRAGGLEAQAISIYNQGQIAGSIVATDLLNMNGGVVTLKTNADRDDLRNSGTAGAAQLSGYFSQESGATLRVAIVSTSDEGSYSYLQAANVELDGTLDVDVKANSGLSLSSGLNSFGIIHGSSSLNGTFSQITDNSALFNFEQRVLSNTLYIDAVRAQTVEQAARDNSNTPGLGAAQVLDSGASGLQEVVDALGQLATAQEVSDAVSQTLPLHTGASIAATQDALSSVNQIVQARIEGSTGLSAGDQAFSDRYVWVKPFGSWAEQENRDGVAGYDARTRGLTLGVDGALSPQLRLGGALAYANIDIDGKSTVAKQSSEVDVYQLVGYGSYSLDERTNLNFQVDVGQGNSQGERRIAFTQSTASSDYDSFTAHAGLGIGRSYALDSSTTVIPSLRADYTWIKDQAYSETGAGALNLQVQSRKSDALVLALEGKLNKDLGNGTQLQANLGVGYDTLNERSSIVSAFAGAPNAAFVTYGAEPSPWQVRGGFGLTHKTASGMEITGRYDALYKTDFLNQTVSVKLRWMF
ncbi:autotransporter outer membrane beta-barrel domain-containing protein [Vogesella sp. AC12]|uniref:autotransporter family protein n=1 Tax=Vogesella sp. AC12 TaxID=2950550 RepID=UPI00210DB1B3|nr:autotransporter outer membrane beta-barrel domain-containing protein [Vogesella sp. AC12]MCQ4145257.1 autotransporter outer membrane beta-barrel domain-containing protein [Vogesella sp. AC12]